MSSYQRPWWLVVNKPAGLVTTVKEEPSANERVFIVRGEPLVQGLAWLTWGPVAAILVVFLLAGIAIGLEVKTQPAAVRGLVIMAFLALPALAWIVATLFFTRLSQKHLQAERQAGAQECVLRLNQARGELYFQTTGRADTHQLAFNQILDVKVAYPIGERNNQAGQLTLDTPTGPVIVLPGALGTRDQKIDLAREIQTAIQRFRDKEKAPTGF